MREQHSHVSCRSLDRLVEAAVEAGAPPEVAEEARLVVVRRFRGEKTPRARAEAYFWGVVRRRALRGAAPRLVESLLAASMATDLIEAGHRPEAVSRQVALVYGDAARHSLLVGDSGRAA
jgi:hypothetical protein